MSEIRSKTAVIGVGGAGCSVVSDLFWSNPTLDTIAVSTDKDTVENIYADKKLFICKAVTQGMGTNGDSMLGKKCAQAHMDDIMRAVSEYDVVYIVAGMGGGTGSGAAPIVAEIAQNLGIITFAIAIKPFSFESARTQTAAEGIAKLKSVCRMTTVVENDKVMKLFPSDTMESVFHKVNISISKFIEKQDAKVLSLFKEQLKNIGTFVDEEEPMLHMTHSTARVLIRPHTFKY